MEVLVHEEGGKVFVRGVSYLDHLLNYTVKEIHEYGLTDLGSFYVFKVEFPYAYLLFILLFFLRALEHLASIELLDLCNEAKVERCREPRDLSSCGRAVESVLNTCGHASLCPECSQRCDSCPICRIPVSKSGNRLRLRFYYECIKVGLISKRCDDQFQDKEEAEQQLTADVERLYSLFDVAIENNLVSLICHYVTDVCMDESVVSSDPIVAFLLDEVVVKIGAREYSESLWQSFIKSIILLYRR
ncbi:RING-type domain-containing protein [Heracleum sosnowskyi]|uniref:RING-type domain-containing protein n=1 Tax=Heracleum sosnowskyi TaxID=360622 RepID=A0AAD8HDR9_9APIA|nr:RING-type domain-containing protein [Heracleum sosnowskyi]